MFGLGAGELFLIFIIALLFLGPKKLPELAKGLGQAIREFQKARTTMMTEIHRPNTDTKEDVAVDTTKLADVEIKVESELPKHS